MPIGAVISQPAADSLYAAYRPVVFRVTATNTDATAVPPVVYCDIYFNDIYYKTLAKTQATVLNAGVNTEWEFDIQDAAQEYLGKLIGAHGYSAIVEATPLIQKVSCKFRSSGYDANGFILHENVAPVQGTSSSDPVAGTGTASNSLYVVNATLQHEDSQSLINHLYYYKKRTWTADAHPLSHRPDNYKIIPGNSDIFPIIYSGDQTFQKLRLNYRLCGQAGFSQIDYNISAPMCTAIISDPVAAQNIGGWLVSWNVVSGAPAKFLVSTPGLNGGVPTETADTFLQLAGLAIGSHTITVRPVCVIEGESYLGSPKTVTLVVSECIAVAIVGAPDLPAGYVGINYDYSIALTGTGPFFLADIVKPAWMNIAVVGSNIEFTGVPDEADEDLEVSFTLTNCGSTYDMAFEDTFDVTAPCLKLLMPLDTELPDGSSGVPYNYSFELTGTMPANLTEIVKPAWMSIDVVGSDVVFSGTPLAPAADVEVSFKVNNCHAVALPFFDTINIDA